MPAQSLTIYSFHAQRVQYRTTRSFDDVLSSLHEHVRRVSINEIIQQSSGDATREEFGKRVEAFTGNSGFMLFLEIKHSEWLPTFGIHRKVIRWIFGNPLIAYTMIRHDITAALFAPVELLLYENESGAGSTITYNLPSSLMVLDENRPLLEAVWALDRKLAALMEQVT